MRETGCSTGGLDYVTTKRPIPEPMRPISVHRLVSDGGDERGTTTVRRIADGSRTAPYYRGSHRRKRGDGEKGAAGRDHARGRRRARHSAGNPCSQTSSV